MIASNFAALLAEALAKNLDVLVEVIPGSERYPKPLINIQIDHGIEGGIATRHVLDAHTADLAEIDRLVLEAREAVRRV